MEGIGQCCVWDFFFLFCFFSYLVILCTCTVLLELGVVPWWAWGWLHLDMVFIPCLDVVDTGCAGCSLWSWHYCLYVPAHMHMCICMYLCVWTECNANNVCKLCHLLCSLYSCFLLLCLLRVAWEVVRFIKFCSVLFHHMTAKLQIGDGFQMKSTFSYLSEKLYVVVLFRSTLLKYMYFLWVPTAYVFVLKWKKKII